jgi:hypothetical protein
MTPISSFKSGNVSSRTGGKKKNNRKTTASILISGGCDKNGTVPLLKFEKEIARLKRDNRIIAHTGFFPPEDAGRLNGLVDVVSFDFPSSTRVIREVFGLGYTQDDYIGSLRALMKHVRVVPHLTAGLLSGKISGEPEALELLKSLDCEKIVMNVLLPVSGTRYEGIRPPPVAEAARLIRKASGMFGSVYLGCMRPAGAYRAKLDTAALGFAQRIVMPSKEARRKVPDAKVFYECCAF